jgi:hypothetical protein
LEGDTGLRSQSNQAGDPRPDLTSSDGAAVALAQDEVVQVKEELRVLMFGFATGMTVAAVFFIYVLLATARLLP